MTALLLYQVTSSCQRVVSRMTNYNWVSAWLANYSVLSVINATQYRFYLGLNITSGYVTNEFNYFRYVSG